MVYAGWMVYAGVPASARSRLGFLPHVGSLELCKIASLRNSMTGVATLVAGFSGAAARTLGACASLLCIFANRDNPQASFWPKGRAPGECVCGSCPAAIPGLDRDAICLVPLGHLLDAWGRGRGRLGTELRQRIGWCVAGTRGQPIAVARAAEDSA